MRKASLAAVAAAAAVTGVGVTVAVQQSDVRAPWQHSKSYQRKGLTLPATYEPGQCTATDGDTVRCGDERIRLVEIDAPELPGHCRAGRVCAPGDPVASKQALQALVGGHRLRVVRHDVDHYGRTVGDVRVVEVSLSCAQVVRGHAIRQLKWGDYGVLRADCP